MADEVDVSNRLDTHDPDQHAVHLVSPKLNARSDLVIQFAGRHVRLVPAVGRDDASIRGGGAVDDRENRLAVVVTAPPDTHRVGVGDGVGLGDGVELGDGLGCQGGSATRGGTTGAPF